MLAILKLGLGHMEQAKNFQETINELKKKIDDSINDLNDISLKYRTSQDKIDQLNVNITEANAQILETICLINDLLTKLDFKSYLINLEDLKKLTNVEILRIINNIIRFLNTKF